MEKLKRSLLFWILTILFFIITPIVILNAKGYRFDLNRGVFVYGGAITLKTNPQTVEVSLNGNLINSKRLNRINNSYNINGLIPGNYDIKVTIPDFQTWSKKIDVHSGMSSEFWNIVLVRNNYKKTELDAYGAEKFFISPKNKFIAYVVKSEQGIILKIFNIKSGKEEFSFNFPEWQLLEDLKMENIEWSPDENFLSVPVQKTVPLKEGQNIESDRYFIVDLNKKESFSLNDFVKKDDLEKVRWISEKGSYLFFISAKSLFRVSVENQEDLTEITSNISSFDVSGDYIYYSDFDNNLLFKINSVGKSQPAQITSGFPEEKCDPIEKLIVYDDSRIIFLSRGKDLYVFNQGEHAKYFRKLGNGISGASFSNDGKKLLFWSNNEISVYFVRDELSQPLQNENKMQNITRFSKLLQNIQWFSDYEHVIFRSEKSIKIIELDPRNRINCMDIASTEFQNSHVVYNEYLKKLYFTDLINGSSGLFSLDFPEENSIFF